MRLEENIYRLRTERGMSQAELAEALEVSRQSASKWETGSAVPELEKLMNMSRLFGVTLDALVTGEEQAEQPSGPEEPRVIVVQEASPARRTVGWMLLGLAALALLLLTIAGSLLMGLLCAAPLAVCGGICLLCRQNCGLWCGWAFSGMAELCLRFLVGANGGLFSGLRSMIRGDIAAVLIGLCCLGVLCLTAVTVHRFGRKSGKTGREAVLRLAVSGVLLVLTLLPWPAVAVGSLAGRAVLYWLLGLVRNWGQVLLLNAFGITLVRMIRNRKEL